ncbi:MAG: PaaI family thioesterase [Nesterenkonia sp.]
MPDQASSSPQGSLENPSNFVAATGFVIDEVSDTRLSGHVKLGEEHFTPWGVVHGGVYTSIVETAGSVAASHAVESRNQFAMGVHNATDFLRASTGGRASVTAEALQQGRTQQLWLIVITDDETSKVLARGQLRLQNVGLPESAQE